MELQNLDALHDRVLGTGQEARPHAIGESAEPQIEAGRLHLVGVERRTDDAATRRQGLDEAGRENPRLPVICVHATSTLRLAGAL